MDFDTFSKSDFRAVKVLDFQAVKKSKKFLQFTLDDGTGTPRTILSGIHAIADRLPFDVVMGKTMPDIEINVLGFAVRLPEEQNEKKPFVFLERLGERYAVFYRSSGRCQVWRVRGREWEK